MGLLTIHENGIYLDLTSWGRRDLKDLKSSKLNKLAYVSSKGFISFIFKVRELDKLTSSISSDYHIYASRYPVFT